MIECSEKKRLIDVFPTPETNGIIKNIYNDMGELGQFFQNIFERLDPDLISSMDMDYIYNHSGFKKISYFLECVLELFGGMTDDAYKRINFIFTARFLDKWKKLWETVKLDYDIISPYDMTITDTTTDTKTITKTVTDKNQKYNTDTFNSHGITTSDRSDINSSSDTFDETVKGDTTDNTEDKTYGFNSEFGVPESDSENTTTDNTTTKNNSTRNETNQRKLKDVNDNDSYQEKTSEETKNNTENATINNPINRNILRKGNIGNITRQQLIAEQRELLQWQFFNVVYNDIDTILSCGMF